MMQLAEYIGKTDFEIIRFAYLLIQDIEMKIKNKAFFYKNQIVTYINKQIDYFLLTLLDRDALLNIYKTEIHQILEPKLKEIYKKYRLFYCL